MSDTKAAKRRLERAGYIYVAGWVPASHPVGDDFERVRARHRREVETIRGLPAEPRGRPLGSVNRPKEEEVEVLEALPAHEAVD